MKHNKLLLLLLVLILLMHPTFAQLQSEIDKAQAYIDKRNEATLLLGKHDVLQVLRLPPATATRSWLSDSSMVFANQRMLDTIVQRGMHFRTLPPQFLAASTLKSQTEGSTFPFTDYPTYDSYVAYLQQLQTQYADIVKLEIVGTTTRGLNIYALKISDNATSDEAEAQVLLSGTIHGNEPVGYWCLLHLTDYLTAHYPTDLQVQNIVDHHELWVIPIINIDGLYEADGARKSFPTRGNNNGIDLNRNFPDPSEGFHPDGNAHQAETKALMAFYNLHNFVLSTTLHSGEEVVNYPWDTWSPAEPDFLPHADDAWFKFVSRQYADTVHQYSEVGYMSPWWSDNGITNGYEWYTVAGSLQDYANYYAGCREITLEINSRQTTPASQAETVWEYNYHSLLNFVQQAGYGLNGIITQSGTEAVEYTVEVENHDRENSETYSHPTTGEYYRPLAEGAYNVLFSNGLQTVKLKNLTVRNNMAVKFDVDFPSAGIVGKIWTDSNNNIGNAGFIAIDMAGNHHQVQVSADGAFTAKLDPGTYNFVLSASGYKQLEINDFAVESSTYHYFDATLSVDVSIPEQSIEVICYPNPFSDKIVVSHSNQMHIDNQRIRLTDNLGRLLMVEVETVSDSLLIIDTQTLLPGIYFLQLYADNQPLLKKLVKTNGR